MLRKREEFAVSLRKQKRQEIVRMKRSKIKQHRAPFKLDSGSTQQLAFTIGKLAQIFSTFERNFSPDTDQNELLEVLS